MRGIILYGAPAAGKDTVTQALRKLNPQYVPFPRLKVGRGRTSGYRMTAASELRALREKQEVLWENERYGAEYVVDRPTLLRMLSEHVPVLHLGQVEAVHAVTTAMPGVEWLVVQLHCPRDVATERIVARGTGDTEARLRAWDETNPLRSPDLTINTAHISAESAAKQIHERLTQLAR